MTQEAVAEKTGIKRAYYTQIENGRRSPVQPNQNHTMKIYIRREKELLATYQASFYTPAARFHFREIVEPLGNFYNHYPQDDSLHQWAEPRDIEIEKESKLNSSFISPNFC